MSDKVSIAFLVAFVYAVYMWCAQPNAPDGILLSGVIGALCALGGVLYQKNKGELASATIQCPEDERQEL